MSPTEEQKRALKRVVAYMDEMYAIASPYHGCTEDANILRAMIDSSGTVEPVGGFDLERARGLRDFLQDDCAEVGDVWAEMIAEIERLRAEISEQKGMIWKTQQVEKEQYAQIKELKADLEQSEWSRRLRLDVIDQRAARIKELEADNQNLVTLNKSLMNNDWILRDNNRKYRKRAQKAELLNKELKSKIGPDADAKPRSPQESDDLKHCHSCGKSIEEVKGNLCKGDYFIGSIFLDPGQEASRFDPPIDASYYFSCCDCARSWQITEERKAAIMETIDLLNGDLFRSPYSDVLAVLRGMLEEVA